jgi:hypothetical protein
MRIRLLVVVGVLTLTACSSNDAKDQPQAIPAETTIATTTTIAPTTTTPNGLGVTQNYREVDPDSGGIYAGRVTVFRYRDASVLPANLESELTKDKKRSVATAGPRRSLEMHQMSGSVGVDAPAP